MPRKYGPRRPEFLKYYSVYDRKTDKPVFIHGTAWECAKAMGIKRKSFYIALLRIRQGLHQPTKYEIFEDEPVTEEVPEE